MDNVGFERLGKVNGDTERDIGKGATVSESSNSRNHLQHGNYIGSNHGLHFLKITGYSKCSHHRKSDKFMFLLIRLTLLL